jgi:hypothetical protein
MYDRNPDPYEKFDVLCISDKKSRISWSRVYCAFFKNSNWWKIVWLECLMFKNRQFCFVMRKILLLMYWKIPLILIFYVNIQ